MGRRITYAAAIHEATDLCLARYPNVILLGEGVPDPKGVFATTLGLAQKYGKNRVFDTPLSENSMTGICIGAALSGLRPIIVHQRLDFSLLSLDQIINSAAKWYYMFSGQKSVPLVIRMIVGRGWGQGPQHAQSLQALFGHIPGLKVVMPTMPADAKGMLIAAVEDNNPVIFIEHRWLHSLSGVVPKGFFRTPLTKANIIKKGKDVTLFSTSYMTVESLRAADYLEEEGILAEVVDARSIKPIDEETLVTSVKKTGRLVVVDTGYKTLGFASEIIALVCEKAFHHLKAVPFRISLPDVPTPTCFKLAENYYPTYVDIIVSILTMLSFEKSKAQNIIKKYRLFMREKSDVPDPSFTGPF